MEPVTQALLGAATAHCVSGGKLGRRALGWGALIGMSPDLDVVLGPLDNGYGEWLYHRGTTHSLWFGFVLGPILGWLLWRLRDSSDPDERAAWIRLAIVALVTHPLLDGFTPYGTQFFAPFDRTRFAWNGVAIVDPFYTIVLAIGVFCVASRRMAPPSRRGALYAALGLSTAYLLIGVGIARWVESDLRSSLASVAGPIDRIRAYPTIFQPWLRSFVAMTPETTIVGLHSWQAAGCPAYRIHPRPKSDARVRLAFDGSREGELLEWFADGDVGFFSHLHADGTATLRMEDLRYAWASPDARGMFGIEVRLDRDGSPRGGIRRIARTTPAARDLSRLARIFRGELPTVSEGWSRPPRCTSAADSG